MDEHEAPITKVLIHYFPNWEPPRYRSGWVQCYCPDHDEQRPSCAVNFDVGAVKCHACEFHGDIIKIIREQEGGSFAQAVEQAERISGGSYKAVQKGTTRKSRRRVFGESESNDSGGSGFLSGVRGRSTPWA